MKASTEVMADRFIPYDPLEDTETKQQLEDAFNTTMGFIPYDPLEDTETVRAASLRCALV